MRGGHLDGHKLAPVGSPPSRGLTVSLRALDAFEDRVILRDPRGRSLNPSLGRCDGPEGPAFHVRGDFIVLHTYSISQEDALAFAEVTGDTNPIHRNGDVVPGAMSASKALLAIEVLLPDLCVKKARVRFNQISRYGQPIHHTLRVVPLDGHRARIEFQAWSGGRSIAEGGVQGEIVPPQPGTGAKKRRVQREDLEEVFAYFDALRVNPSAFLYRRGELNLVYPRAFLASLPSGEMVRRFQGEGGLLTRLELDFPNGGSIPITGRTGFEVFLERLHSRAAFNKVLTLIRCGFEECCRGFAIVLAPHRAM